MTYGWVNYKRIFMFRWTIPLRLNIHDSLFWIKASAKWLNVKLKGWLGASCCIIPTVSPYDHKRGQLKDPFRQKPQRYEVAKDHNNLKKHNFYSLHHVTPFLSTSCGVLLTALYLTRSSVRRLQLAKVLSVFSVFSGCHSASFLMYSVLICIQPFLVSFSPCLTYM